MKLESVTEWKHTTEFSEANKLLKVGWQTYKIISVRVRNGEFDTTAPCYILGKCD